LTILSRYNEVTAYILVQEAIYIHEFFSLSTYVGLIANSVTVFVTRQHQNTHTHTHTSVF